MSLYRKKPVVVTALQWDGTPERAYEIAAFMGATEENQLIHTPSADAEWQGTLTIPTLEGDMIASVGDYIIRGVQGEFYPCKPDIFAATYELADGPTKAVVQIDPVESECLEIRFLEDPPEVVVLRHGMAYPEGGEAVYSELLDPDI